MVASWNNRFKRIALLSRLCAARYRSLDAQTAPIDALPLKRMFHVRASRERLHQERCARHPWRGLGKGSANTRIEGKS